jgi:prepilin signal peptidase PulO-like enzyme (type II secretory pathway)
LAGSLITFAVCYILYRAKQIGGGDVKLFVAVGAVLSNTYLFGYPLLFSFAIILLFTGGIYTLVWGMFLFFKDYSTAVKKLKPLLNNYYKWRIALMIIAFLFLVASIFMPTLSMKLLIALLAVIFILSFYLILFIKVVESLHFIKTIPVTKLTEGDWLAKDVKYKNRILLSSRIHSLEKKHIQLLKKYNIKQVIVKLGIPFVPAILLSFIFSLMLYGILG